MTAVTIEMTFTALDCPWCAFDFAIPAPLHNRRLKDGKEIWCPACGKSMNWGKSEADKLREQLETAGRQLASAQGTITHLRDQNDATERALRAQRGANTKLRKRVANGICPCCNRSFANLERHMAGKHPDYAEAVADA